MAQERKNPIPPGVYWVDIIDQRIADPVNLKGFNAWAMANAPHVRVLQKERELTGDPLDWFRGQKMWTLFRLDAPVPRWPKSVAIGLPTIAPQGDATKKGGTGKRPKEQGVKDYWLDRAGLPNMSMPSGGAIVALLLGAWALSRR